MGRAPAGAERGRRGKGESSGGAAGGPVGKGLLAGGGGRAGGRRRQPPARAGRRGRGGRGSSDVQKRTRRARRCHRRGGGGAACPPGPAPPRPSAGGGGAAIGWSGAGAGPAGGRAASLLAGAARGAELGAAARGVGRAGAEREVGGGGGGGGGRAGERRAPPPPRHPPGAGEPLTNAHCALGDSTVRVTAANLLLGHHCAAASPPRTRASKPRRPPALSASHVRGSGVPRSRLPHRSPLSCLQRLPMLGSAAPRCAAGSAPGSAALAHGSAKRWSAPAAGLGQGRMQSVCTL
ncbi:unnamed protein product, partial [Coccothraustes coccothraustes]